MDSLQTIKQRFGIIGNNNQLNLAIQKAMRVAPTDISVLVTGESGVGKEVIPKIIHNLSHRKHAKYIAVNCGAIPEGTIDSELFGHEKGSFTGASQTRNGYFEVADGGTIFLDEVGELPLTTQVRLLRVLENGEFLKVGSSKVQKTDVRIVAATNLNMEEGIQKGKFREDLYYRLSTVEINLPALRNRPDDIHLLFRKFASDFATKYNMPTVRLDDAAIEVLVSNQWKGNIRQLRNLTEQISVIEQNRNITGDLLRSYLPDYNQNLPALVSDKKMESDFANEREILYKILFDMRNDITDLKKLTKELLNEDTPHQPEKNTQVLIDKIYGKKDELDESPTLEIISQNNQDSYEPMPEIVSFDDAETIEETVSLQEKEVEMIKQALERNKGKRKLAAKELGISERTLYRKINQYNL
ncbi:MAG: sigma-54-dependent Fis family transcriptional regulator [Flavobacteriales bacterium]|nr:sigma-54-dependent Fis family transcriptional regulator [Flavobacteriales bacterium]